MREIIGENLQTFIENMHVNAVKTYSGNIGYWPKFEVWEIPEDDYEKICGLSDEEYEQVASDDSWWRGANGSNQGIPFADFIVNGHSIVAWRNIYKLADLQVEWDELPSEEKAEYKDFDDYCEVWFPKQYKDLLEYFCDELGASTERNVCALATDLAKYNDITMAELFRKYGGSNENN